MKKQYETPIMEMVEVVNQGMLMSGSVYGNGTKYGGVDTSGSKNPESREFDFEDEDY